jgi:adenylate cyclase
LALRDLLNQYFSTVTRIVHAHGGTLDKFIGDAVMAFWGAPIAQPDHALRAVQAALALAQASAPLNEALHKQGLPTIEFGIGLATGVVCVGDLGSQLRRSYTAVGDAVNLAARLEALTRQQGVQILIADTTRTACGDQLHNVEWVEVDQTQVRGRQQSVTVFTPIPISGDQTDRLRAQVRTLRLALAAAHSQDANLVADHLAELFALQESTSSSLDPMALQPGARIVGALAARLSLPRSAS